MDADKILASRLNPGRELYQATERLNKIQQGTEDDAQAAVLEIALRRATAASHFSTDDLIYKLDSKQLREDLTILRHAKVHLNANP